MADREYEYKITADIAQFRSAMQESAQVSRQSAQQIGDAFRGAGAGLSSLSAGLGSLRNLLTGLGVGAAVANLGRSIVAATLEAEQSAALLNATLRATGYAAGLSSGDVEELVTELQKVSQFDDDPLRQGVTALLRFREVSGDTFREASRLAVDLAVATGRDLPSAFTAIGKALQDPTGGMKALREAGVQLSEGQQELAAKLLETGNVAGAQKIVLDELRASVGGAGGTGSEGLTGATRSLANAWDNLLTNIGRLPAVAGASQGVLQSLSRAVSRTADAIGFFGTPDGSTIGKFDARLAELRADRARYAASNADTSAIDLAIASAERSRSDALRSIGELAVSRSGPSTFDARDLALLRRGGGPAATDKEAEAAARRLAAEKKRLLEEQFRDELAFNKALSDAEIRELERVADERQRLEDEIAQERIKALQAGPEEAERQARRDAERVRELLANTSRGKEKAIEEDIGRLNDALSAGKITADDYRQAWEEIEKRFDSARDFGDKLTASTTTNTGAMQDLADAVRGVGRAFNEELVQSLRSGQFEASKILDALISDFARLYFYRTITQPLFNAAAGAIGGSAGGVPGPQGTPFAFNFGGAKAAGGDVFGGNWYLVGERGPERLYVPPGASGTVVPNGGGMTVVQNISVDARSDISSVRAAIFEATTLAQSMDQRAARRG